MLSIKIQINWLEKKILRFWCASIKDENGLVPMVSGLQDFSKHVTSWPNEQFTKVIIRDINIIMRAQDAAVTALVPLVIYCFIHMQGIHFDLVVYIIIIVSVYFWVQSHIIHYSILAYSIINFLNRRFWIFRICIIKWSNRVPWECYHWNNLQGG